MLYKSHSVVVSEFVKLTCIKSNETSQMRNMHMFMASNIYLNCSWRMKNYSSETASIVSVEPMRSKLCHAFYLLHQLSM
jgi:hypothetical protein